MNHLIIIMHFISFTSGIILITLANFVYPKYKSPLIKNVLLGDIFYTLLLLLDTLDLYIRKNILSKNELVYALFDIGQYVVTAVCLYYLFNIIHNLIDVEFTIIKRRLYRGAALIFLLIITMIYVFGISKTGVGEYILKGFVLLSYFMYIYCLAVLIKNLLKVKKEIKRLIFSCLLAILIIVPWLLLTNTLTGLPSFMYKIPYFPVMYFFINAFGVVFIQRNITYEKNCVENNTNISMEDAYDVFAKRHGITERELEIVKLIADGNSNPDIGEKLFISLNTVKNHIYNIYKKIGIKNRFELISLLSQIKKPE